MDIFLRLWLKPWVINHVVIQNVWTHLGAGLTRNTRRAVVLAVGTVGLGNSLTRACLVVCVTRSYEGSARIWQRRYTAKPPALKLVRELGETAAPRVEALGRKRGRVCLNAFQRGVWHITPLV